MKTDLLRKLRSEEKSKLKITLTGDKKKFILKSLIKRYNNNSWSYYNIYNTKEEAEEVLNTLLNFNIRSRVIELRMEKENSICSIIKRMFK